MRLFAIGDVHLPGGPQDKPMDRFGEVWEGHVDSVADNWANLATDDDVLLIVGDLSWAMNIREAVDDLAWLAALPGRVAVIRGNHDYWWSSISKVRVALGPAVTALQHDHVVFDGVAIVGTRGWQCPGSIGSADVMAEGSDQATYSEQDAKVYRREVGRLRLALEGLRRSGEEYERLVVALHYPPVNPEHQPSGFTDLIDEFGADFCVYGHLHGAPAHATAIEGVRGATEYHCVSADKVRMVPRQII